MQRTLPVPVEVRHMTILSKHRIALRQLQYFVAVAENLHFTKAAEQLSVAQPVISRAIAELESEVGVKLLDRSTRAVRLTPAGDTLLTESRRLFGHIDRSIEATRHAARESPPAVRVGYSEFSMNGKLPALVKRYRKRYPQYRLQLSFMSTVDQRRAILSGRIDVAFMQGYFDRPDIESVLYQHDKLFVICSHSNPLSERTAIWLRDLQHESFVFGDPTVWGTFREAVFNSCRLHGLNPTVVQEANNGVGILALVSADIGISIYASQSGKSSHPGLASIPIRDRIEPLTTFFCSPAHADDGGPISALKNLVGEAA